MGEATPPTGRLFRSLRAEGSAATDAVPALSLDEVVSLRSVSLASSPAPETVNLEPDGDSGTKPDLPVMVAAAVIAEPAPVDVLPPPVAVEAAIAAEPDAPIPADPDAVPTASRKPGAHAQRGTGAGGVWLVVIGVTLVMAFADALVVHQATLGWLTGASLLVASIYAAIVVRPGDAIIAVVAPPLAFFLATITAGQLTLTGSGDLMVREAFMIVTTLGTNAAWIFGATVAALVIVLARRIIARRR